MTHPTANTAHRWTYEKDGGLNYPVQPGQVWKVGPHYFVCSDLIETTLLDSTISNLVAADPALQPTLVYSDPPWNQGNLSSFRTKAAKARANYTIWQLYARIFNLFPEVPHLVEGGIKEIESVPFPNDPSGKLHVQRWPITYYRKHPCVLHYVGQEAPPAAFNPTNLHDDFTPQLAMRTFPRGVVVDPCAGRGLTARTAAQEGWVAITNEMSPWRMSAAMTSVVKIVGVEPERVK